MEDLAALAALAIPLYPYLMIHNTFLPIGDGIHHSPCRELTFNTLGAVATIGALPLTLPLTMLVGIPTFIAVKSKDCWQ